MALENARDFFKRMSEPIIKRLEGVEPYVLTWMTLPTGLAAAWCMMNATRDSSGALMFVGAFFLMGCAMALDGLDGNLARATGKVTRWGDYLDHSFDRVLDVVWILALGYNVYWFGDIEIAWAAAMLTMFGSYLGTQAQAVAGSRNYGGFSRADRMMLTLIALLAAAVMGHLGSEDWYTIAGISLNPISAIVLIAGIGGIYTFILRFLQARAEIGALDKSEPLSTMKTNDIVDDD
jgi:archaetidylinositol phosphate synthase